MKGAMCYVDSRSRWLQVAMATTKLVELAKKNGKKVSLATVELAKKHLKMP